MCETPDSHQTSTMSFSARSSVPPHAAHAVPCRQVLGRVLREPRVGALGLEELDDGIERLGRGHGLAALHAGEDRDRHTPGALAGDAPVGAIGDHGLDAIDRPARNPLDLLDRVESALAQRAALLGMVHRDEPLLGRAEDHRLLAAPAVRVAVLGLAGVEHVAPLGQPVDDRWVRLVDVLACERTAALIEDAVCHRRASGIGRSNCWPTSQSSSPWPGAVCTAPVPVESSTWAPVMMTPSTPSWMGWRYFARQRARRP